MQLIRKCGHLAAACALAALAALPAGRAQTTDSPDTPDDSATRDDLITVTATRTEREVDGTPVAVSTLPLAELKLRIPRDLEDLLKYEPGVEVSGTDNSYGQGPIIRGLGGDRVLIQMDGARVNFGSGHKGELFVEPAWLRRVEVLRGPGSTLYGSDALAGVLSLETIDPSDILGPSDIFGLSQTFGYAGNNEEFQTVTTAAGRLGRDGLGSRIEYLVGFGLREAGDTYSSAREELDYTEESPRSGLGKVVLWLSDADRLELSYYGYSLDQNADADIYRETRQQNWAAEFEHDGDNPLLHLTLRAYYSDMGIDEDDRSSSPNNEMIDFTTLGFSAQNSSQFQFGDEHDLTLTYGGEWYRDRQEASVDGSANFFFPEAESDNYAVFAQAEIALWDDLLTLIPGIRGDWYDRSAEGQEDVTDSAVSPKLGIALKLDDEIGLADGDYLVLHGSWGRGYRAPNFQELYIDGAHPPFGPFNKVTFEPNPELQPETSETIEGGARLKIGKVRLGGTVFRTTAEDFIDYSESVSFVFPNLILTLKGENVDEATITGSEWYAEWQATDALRFWGNYTMVRGDNETTGEPLASVAPDAAKLGVDWSQRDLGLTLGLRARHYADYDRKPTDTAGQSGFELFDAVAEWQPTVQQVGPTLHGLALRVAVENLADREYNWFTGTPGHGINPVMTLTYTKTW